MKKVLFVFSLFLFYSEVNAVTPPPDVAFGNYPCTTTDIARGQKDLEKFSYDLQYVPDATDREGNPLDGYMKVSFVNLPTGYKVELNSDEYHVYTATPDLPQFSLPGGVYMITVYKDTCSTPIKKINMRIPHYKAYCGVNVKCSVDPWFDGTYENSASNQKRPKRTVVSTVLIIILIILLLLVGTSTYLLIKRRRDNAKAL